MYTCFENIEEDSRLYTIYILSRAVKEGRGCIHFISAGLLSRRFRRRMSELSLPHYYFPLPVFLHYYNDGCGARRYLFCGASRYWRIIAD